MKIEFVQPKPRVEDWNVRVNGRNIGSVWRAGSEYITSVTTKCRATTLDAAFKTARKQAKSITSA